MTDDEILNKLKSFKLFSNEDKTNIIKFFPNYSIQQKTKLIEIMDKEREILLESLKELKNREDMSFEEIQYGIQNVFIQNIRLQELKENEAENCEEILSSNLAMQ
jgi:hypothetical protein